MPAVGREIILKPATRSIVRATVFYPWLTALSIANDATPEPY
jgi:hypothetical protein